MGILIMANKGNYVNADAVSNVVHYITRTRKNEDRKDELVYYNGFGVTNYFTPEEMIRQICRVQQLFNINGREGRRVYHEFFLISPEEFMRMNEDIECVVRFAADCGSVYFNMGYQVVYAVHFDKEKKLHIHFCVNTINYNTGRKWHSSKQDLKARENLFNVLLSKYLDFIVPKRVSVGGNVYEKVLCGV